MGNIRPIIISHVPFIHLSIIINIVKLSSQKQLIFFTKADRMLHFIDYIYFFYGLAFFLLGFSILHYPTKNSIFKFGHDLKYLGVFGILHGTSEWLVMFRLLEKKSADSILMGAGFTAMALSYIILLYFAFNVIWGRKRALKTISFVVILWLVAIMSLDKAAYNEADILIRYMIALPGIFLTAYIFSHPDYIVQGSVYKAVKVCMFTFSAAFALYGFLAGIIVPEGTFFPASVLNTETFQSFTGLPVQLFRLLSAIIASHAIGRILLIFKTETDRHLLKLSSALEESGDTVVITNTEGEIEYVNRLFGEQTGYSPNEVIGKNPKILQSGEHPEPFYAHLWNTILTGKNYRNVIINKRKDGTLYHEFKTIVPLRNKHGEITNFISTGKDISSRITFEHELEKAAATDPLTGVANRLQCDRWLKATVEYSQKNLSSATLIMFDIDDFKHVNDTFGHNVGDDVLVRIADIVRTIVRSNDMFARWGGEEFVILQTDTPLEGTSALAERIRKEIENLRISPVGNVTVSLGVAAYEGNESIESFVKQADEAMYQAKRMGKNNVVVSDGNEKKIA